MTTETPTRNATLDRQLRLHHYHQFFKEYSDHEVELMGEKVVDAFTRVSLKVMDHLIVIEDTTINIGERLAVSVYVEVIKGKFTESFKVTEHGTTVAVLDRFLAIVAKLESLQEKAAMKADQNSKQVQELAAELAYYFPADSITPCSRYVAVSFMGHTGNFDMDTGKASAYVLGEPMHLTPNQFAAIAATAPRKNRV